MAVQPDASAALALISKLSDLGIEGKAPAMKTAVELAEEYLDDSGYGDDDARIVAKRMDSPYILGGDPARGSRPSIAAARISS